MWYFSTPSLSVDMYVANMIIAIFKINKSLISNCLQIRKIDLFMPWSWISSGRKDRKTKQLSWKHNSKIYKNNYYNFRYYAKVFVSGL